ncbi:reverse transcriptase domain-containing protein [Clostridium botulinum]|uniref:reverse transcriptase domain-containing protein n=1 Tax=Clostridium botulinum TaxID=1491 RepID=UPI000697EE00|nr:reverse transcriptase domain-containing protein [Clostridium botulinum]MCR1146666.1 reverse transcriptase domain-containing protein [Clostridium botulinum]
MPWIIEFDIIKIFNNINHEKLMKAVKINAKEKCMILYIARFLTAPIQMLDGTVRKRDSGTPQGGVISSVLANVYMHYAFDRWMSKEFTRLIIGDDHMSERTLK